MDLTERFAVCAGSLLGREHARLHRNNQDALAVAVTSERIAAVVTDGCGEGRSSEVGARLGARFIAQWLVRQPPEWGDPLVLATLDYLRPLVPTSTPGDAAAFVRDHLLFTFLALLVDAERTVVFGLGDGVWALNGRAVVIPSGEDNAPPYLGYGLVDPTTLDGAAYPLRPAVHVSLPTAEIRSLLVGTDGLAALESTAAPLADGSPQEDLEGLTRDLRYAKNPSLLQRRLVVLGERNRRLHDDATAVLLQRRED